MNIERLMRLTAIAIGLSTAACGGEAAPAPAPVPAPPTTAHASTSARSRGAPVDLSGPEFQGDHTLPGDPAAGEAVYLANCIACHASDGSGNGGMTGGDFVHDPVRLARNNETLLRSIREGIPNSPAMPPWAETLTDQQMRDALSYIRQRFTPGELASAP